jgi:hypothetical protein
VTVATDAGPVAMGASGVASGEDRGLDVAMLVPFCAQQDREKIVHLATELSDASGDVHPHAELFVVNGGPREPSPQGLEVLDRARLELVERTDLNGDGRPEWIMVAPDLAGQGDSLFSVYFDCGAGAFYPLLAAYGTDYEVRRQRFKGWDPIVLRSHTPGNDPATVRRTTATLRFNGTKYE